MTDPTPPAPQGDSPADQGRPTPPPPPAPAPPPVPPAPPYPPAGYAQPGYPQPGYPTGPVTSQNAIIGLVLAVVSWVACPVIPAIIALVLASKSSQEIAASGGRIGGEGLNTATRIVSWINIAFYGLGIIVVGLLFAFGVFAAGVNA